MCCPFYVGVCLMSMHRFHNQHKLFVVVYSFDGLIVFGLLVICTCAYMSRVPRLKQWLLSEKKGFFGIFYKGKFFHWTVRCGNTSWTVNFFIFNWMFYCFCSYGITLNAEDYAISNLILFSSLLLILNKYHHMEMYTIKPVLFVCPLFCKFCDLGDFAKITGGKYLYFSSSLLVLPVKMPKLRVPK